LFKKEKVGVLGGHGVNMLRYFVIIFGTLSLPMKESSTREWRVERGECLVHQGMSAHVRNRRSNDTERKGEEGREKKCRTTLVSRIFLSRSLAPPEFAITVPVVV